MSGKKNFTYEHDLMPGRKCELPPEYRDVDIHKVLRRQSLFGILDKPPIGVKPCYIQADGRIKDLSDAISRYAENSTGNYETIRKWAKEILMQCDIAEMEKK